MKLIFLLSLIFVEKKQLAAVICARALWLGSVFFQVWQHCDCMGVNSDVEHYLCEQCEPRAVNRVNQNSPSYCSYKLQQLLSGGFCIYLEFVSFGISEGSVPWGVSFSLESVAAQFWIAHGVQLRIVFLLSLQEVPMIPRPHYAQPGCVYYICLLRDDLLLRQGTCWPFHHWAGISGKNTVTMHRWKLLSLWCWEWYTVRVLTGCWWRNVN